MTPSGATRPAVTVTGAAGARLAPSGPPVVTDTGPLLCFGVVRRGVALLGRRWHGRVRWAGAVAGELDRLASDRSRPHLAKAAAGWTPMARQLLGSPVDLSAHATRVQERQELVRSFKDGRKPPAGPDEDRGEAETIVLAELTRAIVVVNEDPARKACRSRGLPWLTTVGVLREAVLAADEGLTNQQGFRLWQEMQKAGLDTGEHLSGPLDLVPGRRRHR